MERSFAALMLLLAGVAISLSAGAWWMQRIAFTPDPTRETAAAILSDADIRIEINTVVTGATAPFLETGVAELGTFVENEVLSTRAGGLGLNLVCADTVILHDLDFNPLADMQAEDRCHRIGQTKPVSIYKLVSEGTVDEDIYKLGERKKSVSEAVLGEEKDSTKEADANTISSILQAALRTHLLSKQQQSQ